MWQSAQKWKIIRRRTRVTPSVKYRPHREHMTAWCTSSSFLIRCVSLQANRNVDTCKCAFHSDIHDRHRNLNRYWPIELEFCNFALVHRRSARSDGSLYSFDVRPGCFPHFERRAGLHVGSAAHERQELRDRASFRDPRFDPVRKFFV